MPISKDTRILILVGDDYEDLELWYPRLRLTEAGATVVVAGDATGKTYRGKNGYPCLADATYAGQRAADYAALVIPGGWMPDKLRRDPIVLDLVRQFDAHGKLIASVCHGPWIDISAGVCRGVRMTGSPGIRDDLVNAGAEYIDAEVVVDRHHITSRRPGDLPAFCREILKWLHK